MNNGGLIHETMDALSYLCYLKNWGKEKAAWNDDTQWGIPKPSAIWIDEDEGVHLAWFDTHDIADVYIKAGGEVRVYIYDNCNKKGFWHFRFPLSEIL